MNVQTEKLENHIARLTVAVEPSRFDKAKKKVARKLARRVNIPGFRKGKAPYRILVNYIGEAPILEEAVEEVGNDVYAKALDESKVEPYASGELADFQLQPEPTFVFEVPMQPTVELNDYRSVRVDYEEPTVEDKDVDEALRHLQEEHALIEESNQPAKLGDRITGDLHGFYDDESDDAETADDGAEDPAADETENEYADAKIHEHDQTIYLDEEREPVPGFADALVGVTPEETREFTLVYPDDEEKYGEFAGREVRFVMDVGSVENVTLPTLNDDFAARVSDEIRAEEEDADEEAEPMTLLELRARLRDDLQEEMENRYRSDYVDDVMEQMVTLAEFAYPEAMVRNQVDSIVENMAQRFGVQMEDYLNLLQESKETLYENENFRESAVSAIRRSLVMRGVLDAETLDVSDDAINEEIEKFLSQFGGDKEQYRGLFDTPEMRANITNNLLEREIIDRIVKIGQGEAPPKVEAEDDPAPVAEGETQAEAASATEPVAEAEADDATADTDEV